MVMIIIFQLFSGIFSILFIICLMILILKIFSHRIPSQDLAYIQLTFFDMHSILLRLGNAQTCVAIS